MAGGEVVTAAWSRGIMRDSGRAAMPTGGLFDSVDFLVDNPSYLTRRGGTAYTGPAMTAATYARAVAYADFTGGSKLVAIGDNGHLYTVTSGTTTDVSTLGSAFGGMVDKPKMRFGQKLLIPNDGTAAAKYYDGTTVTAFPGSAPNFKYFDVYKTYICAGGVSAQPQRVYFSPTPDFTAAWDTTYSFWDFDQAVTGLCAIQNSLIVFMAGSTMRLIGSLSPPGSDFVAGPVGQVGCTDARSICVYQGNAIFANPNGVYMTNGVGFTSLTETDTQGFSLVGKYWRSLLATYNASTWTLSAGIYQDYYIVSILNGSGTFVDCLVCHIPTRAWTRFSNVAATMFAQATGAAAELYFSSRSTNRVVTLGSLIGSVSAATKNDADGTAVAPSAQLHLLGDGTNLKRFGHGRLTYLMQDAASDNPTLAVQYAEGLSFTAYEACAESPFAETSSAPASSASAVERKRFTVNRESQVIGMSIAQTNASADTRIYAVELEARDLPYVSEGS